MLARLPSGLLHRPPVRPPPSLLQEGCLAARRVCTPAHVDMGRKELAHLYGPVLNISLSMGNCSVVHDKKKDETIECTGPRLAYRKVRAAGYCAGGRCRQISSRRRLRGRCALVPRARAGPAAPPHPTPTPRVR